jgi:hypothetical protein
MKARDRGLLQTLKNVAETGGKVERYTIDYQHVVIK